MGKKEVVWHQPAYNIFLEPVDFILRCSIYLGRLEDEVHVTDLR